jgi:hypothetical protein
MAKLDRLGWVDGMSFNSFGVRWGIRVSDASILKSITELLPPESRPTSETVVDHLYSLIGSVAKPNSKVRPLNLAYWNLDRIARSRGLQEMLEAFASHVQLTVAEYSPRRVFVHAGVVGWNNRAIVIPGRSYSGKTTLVAELIRAGATYYSDEYAIFDERGRVHPYSRPLAIRDSGSHVSNKVTADEIGARTGSKPLPVGLVVSMSFKTGAQWRPRRLSQGKGILELLANTVSVRSRPQMAMNVLPKTLQSAQVLKGVRDEAAAVVESILAHCDGVGTR